MAIIADDVSANRALGRFLRGAGFEPNCFDSAESFLADERRFSFGCVLLDVQLKGMSGLELQRQPLAVGNRTPLIFITAHEDLSAREEAIRQGCAGFFRNIDPGALLVDAVALRRDGECEKFLAECRGNERIARVGRCKPAARGPRRAVHADMIACDEGLPKWR